MEKNLLLLTELDEIVAALALPDADRDMLIERADEFPLASSVFLQLLRHNEVSDNQQALFAESLAYSTLQASSEFKHWLVVHQARQISLQATLDTEPLILARDQNQLMISLNHPHTRNAYSAAMRDALYEALCLLEADTTLEKCVIKGEGDCFCVGGDLQEFGVTTDPAQAHLIRMARPVASLLLKHAARIECQVHRACIGSGIELPACVGKLIATRETFFQLPELAMGLIPGAGGTVSILRRIGRHRLAWWVLSGKKIKAETALQWGLIDQIV